MKRVHVLGVTLLAGFVMGCAVPAHAETFTCKSEILGVDAPEIVTDARLSLETHQGLTELALQENNGHWLVFASADLNKPTKGDGKISAGTYLTTLTRPDGVKVKVYEVGSGLVVESIMFRDICTGDKK